MNDNRKKLLWVDDDYKKGRFTYEEEVITEDLGWSLTWVESLEEAVELLSSKVFDALILDQQFYITKRDPEDQTSSPEKNIPWQGITLLYWLRNEPDAKEEKRKLANHSLENVSSSLAELREFGFPEKENEEIPVFMLSAVHNDDILNALRNASDMDMSLNIYCKPVDIDEIEDFIDRCEESLNG